MVLNPFSAFGGNDAPPQQGDAVVRPPPGALHVGEPADVLDRLPAEAQDALTDLRERVDGLHADVRRATDRMFDESKAFAEAEANFLVISDSGAAMRMGNGRTLDEDNPEYVRRQASMEKAQARHRKAIAKSEALGQRWQKAKRLLTDVEAYIAAAGNLTMAPALKVKLPTVDRLASEVEKIRKDIAELQADKHAVTSAAYPSAEIKARARAEIEALAERGKPQVVHMIDHGPGEGIFWPDVVAKSRIRGGMAVPLPGDVPRVSHDLPGGHLALIAWLLKDRMIEAIEVEIDSIAEDGAALSGEARAARLAEIDGRILDAERIEAAIIRNAGGSIDFREDADPRAVLGLSGPPPRGED